MTKHEIERYRELALKWRFSGRITVTEPTCSPRVQLQRDAKAGQLKGWAKKPAKRKAK